MNEVENNLDVIQYLVTEKMAYFSYVSKSIIDLVDTDEINDATEDSSCYTVDDSNCYAADDSNYCYVADDSNCYDADNSLFDGPENNGYDDCTTYVDGGSIYDDGGQTYGNYGQTCNNSGQTYDERESTYDNVVTSTSAVNDECVSSVGAPATLDEDDGEESGYLKFCLEPNVVAEGSMCRVTGPTSLTLVITKISGVDLSVAKDKMYRAMLDKCGALPPLDLHIIPGIKHNG